MVLSWDFTATIRKGAFSTFRDQAMMLCAQLVWMEGLLPVSHCACRVYYKQHLIALFHSPESWALLSSLFY